MEGTGKKGKSQYCLWRSFTDPKICVLPDVASELGLTSSQISIKHGCDFEKNKDLKLFFLQTCFDEGVEQVPIAGGKPNYIEFLQILLMSLLLIACILTFACIIKCVSCICLRYEDYNNV